MLGIPIPTTVHAHKTRRQNAATGFVNRGDFAHFAKTEAGIVFNFEGRDGVSIGSIKDGTSNTLLVLEVDEGTSVVWSKPDDFTYDVNKPLLGLGSAHPGGFQAALADGSVHFLATTIDPDVFLRLLMMADGQRVEF